MDEGKLALTNTSRRICIKTWYGTSNYGSNLQAIGLSRMLEELGYDVYFLNKFRVFPYMIMHPAMLFARALNFICINRRKKFFTPVRYDLTDRRKERIECFKKTHFKEISYVSIKEWKKEIENRTIFVAGGDILWNPALGYPSTNFLDFAYYAGLSRFSFGTSVGANKIQRFYYRAYKRYLISMKGIGVREHSVAEMFNPFVDEDIKTVVDPSLLLGIDFWDSVSENSKISVDIAPGGFVLCYFVMNDPKYWKYVEDMKQSVELQIVVLPMHEIDEKQPYSVILDGTTCEFVWLIKNAEFICTDSYHACVLATIYHKEFYLMRRSRKSEDSKYDEFLDRYRLKDRAVSDETHFIRQEHVDYSYADMALIQDKQQSLDFLKKTLGRC